MKMLAANRSTRGDSIHEAFLQTATAAFATEKYDRVSPRAVASGWPESIVDRLSLRQQTGLYRAVSAHVTGRIRARLDPAMTASGAVLTGTDAQNRHVDCSALCCLTEGPLALMAAPVSAGWARLIIHEQGSRCDAFDIFYGGFMDRFLGLIGRLVERLRGRSRRRRLFCWR